MFSYLPRADRTCVGQRDVDERYQLIRARVTYGRADPQTGVKPTLTFNQPIKTNIYFQF